MPRRQALGAVVVSFAIGVLVGAGSLWAVQSNGSSSDAVVAASPSSSNTVVETPRSSEAFTYDPSLSTIEYQVITDGMSVTHLSYVDVVDGEPVMKESLGSPPPFAHVIQVPKGDDFDLAKLSVTAMGAATSTTTTCTLKVDGQVVARQTAVGTYGLVNCAISDGNAGT